MISTASNIFLLLSTFLFWVIRVHTQEQFKVLKVSNVPFPRSSAYPATITTSFGEDVTDFTVCYRIFLDSYNDGIFLPVKHSHYSEWFEGPGASAGWGTEGYNGGVKEFTYPWVGAGFVRKRFPRYHHFNLANNIEISTWYHLCSSYSL